MAKPPKTRRKLNPEARAEIGLPRECDTCGEIKAVSNKAYAQHNAGKRGWATTCRVCQGVAASEKGLKKSTKKTKSTKVKVREGHEYNELIATMYLMAETNRDPARIEEIAQELRDRVLSLADGGDRRSSFRLFIQIVQPLIAGWMEPGPIHEDIIDGLLSQDRRRLIVATRYSAKSTLTGIYIAWCIMLNPLVKVMVISKGAKLASRMLRTVRRVFLQNCPMLTHLTPIEDCLDNAEQFQTPQSLKVTTGGATMSSFGITSDLPGYRADISIGDDDEAS